MEEKVQTVLTLITEDGDSFAKRAEMYYKKRPELIHFVEETYRAYRSLAERYDHISTELQNANNTIASVFPEQVQFAMDDEDEFSSPRPKKPLDMSKGNIPNVPKGPTKDFKSLISKATVGTKKLQPQKSVKSTTVRTVPKSGLSKPEGLEEIDKIQKQILALQTEKEFVKSSYENGLAKYWEIENNIKGMQEKVCSLQDEFGEGLVIEDNDARNLMAAAALKSCQDTLTQLQMKQESSAKEARVESQRVKDARKNFESLKNKLPMDQANPGKPNAKKESVNAVKEETNSDQEVESVIPEGEKLEELQEKIKEHFDAGSNESLTVSEMTEKIDELVSKVISLETAITSQTALVNRLRSENDEIYEQIRTLEDDKVTLTDGKNDLSKKLKELEEKLQQAQDLNKSVENQHSNLQIHFTEAHCNLDHISHKLETVKPDEEPSASGSSKTNEASLDEAKLQKKLQGGDNAVDPVDGLKPVQEVKSDEDQKATVSVHKDEESPAEVRPLKETKQHEETPNAGDGSVKAKEVLKTAAADQGGDVCQSPKNKNEEKKLVHKDKEKVPRQTVGSLLDMEMEATDEAPKQKDEPNWQQLFKTGMEDKEKILLSEYTATLRNYKDLKKKFSEAENDLFETSVQMKELKSANAVKDEEIKALHKKLDLLLQSLGENQEVIKALEQGQTPTEKEENDPIKAMSNDQTPTTSAIEEKFRASIDELLEENLDFWLKFSTSFHQIQKFETSIEDLQSDISKLEERRKKPEGSSHSKHSLTSDARPLYKHLMEIQTELNVWMEKGSLLKDERQCRFSSLCDIQEEITKALKTSAEDGDFDFTSYQAAKFQGEILNMKQENNKVADELQAGMDHVTTLQLEVEKSMAKLNEEYKFSASKKQQPSPQQLAHSESRSSVPLRSFIFGVSPKKQKRSLFAVVAPAMHKRYHAKARSQSS